MDPGLKVEIITRDFGRMLEQLAAIDPTIEFREVLYAVAARVCFNAMNRTKAAQTASIRRTWEEKEYTTFRGKRYKLSNRYPDALWEAIWQFRRDRLAIKLAARGLSKKSWYHLAGQLGGTSARVPAYVLEANYRGNDHPENASSTYGGVGDEATLSILNSSPIVQAAGGRGALLSAMQGEIGYFRQNLAHHAFRSIESRAKAYPGIFTSPVPAAPAAA